MIDFITGFIVGAILVGSSIQRTLSVGRGELNMSLANAIVNSITYFFSVYWISQGNISAYIGTCIGSTLVVALLCIRNRDKIEALNKVKRSLRG